MRRFGVLVLLLGFLTTPAQPQSTVQERASAIVIEIPVTVLGKDGRPLAGLEAKDFELYDDGKKQAINAVDVIDLSAPSAAVAPEALPPPRRSPPPPAACGSSSSTRPTPARPASCARGRGRATS